MKQLRMVLGGSRGALGGTERIADYLERQFEQDGWSVEWLSPADLAHVPVSRRYPGLNHAFRVLAMARQLRRLKPVDLTLSHGMFGWGARGKRLHVYHGTFAGMAAACQPGLPRLDYLVLRWVNGWCERASGLAAGRIAVSRQVGLEVKRYYGRHCQRTVHNGVDPVHFAADTDRQAARARWGLPEDRQLVLIVGRMDYGKGREVVRRAMELLPPTMHVVLAAPESAKIDTLPQERLHLLPGVSYDRLPALYRACDVLFCPSLYEGFGLTLIESWAAGLPVVTGRVGVVGELEGQEEAFDSCVAGVGDAERFAALLQRLAADPELAARQKEWGAETVRSRFTLERFGAAYRQAAEETLSGH